MRTTADRKRARDGWAVDELLDGYVSWREECQEVWVAYDRVAVCDRGERRMAYAAYLAALDREERAADTYADQLERVRRISA